MTQGRWDQAGSLWCAPGSCWEDRNRLGSLSQCPAKGAAPRTAPGWPGPFRQLSLSLASLISFHLSRPGGGPHCLCGLALPLWGIQRLHSVNANGSCHMGAGQVPGHRTSCPPSSCQQEASSWPGSQWGSQISRLPQEDGSGLCPLPSLALATLDLGSINVLSPDSAVPRAPAHPE